ncbi:MAG: PH domain-containing protein [Planctomycetota bacterium]|jgi:uncharacterized membrane protein YdbT with pleckstrin-like domain
MANAHLKIHSLPKKQATETEGRWSQQTVTEAQEAKPEPIAAVDIVPANLLDGGEIVILAVKPSLWFIIFSSARWLAAMILIALTSKWLGDWIPYLSPLIIVQTALAIAAVRICLAMLLWVSRLYVLTNRRIMRLTGIFNIDLFECQLTKIQNTHLTCAWYERIAGLGTISFATAGTGGIVASWTNVNNPMELHERVRSAIHRAKKPMNEI